MLEAIIVGEGVAGGSRVLAMPKSSVGRALARLEAAAGGPLFDRVGRRLRLTPLGKALRPAASAARNAQVAADSALATNRGGPQGLLRIASPVLFGQRIVAPVLAALLRRYPSLRAELILDQRPQDPLVGAFDLAIQIGAPGRAALVSRRIASLRSGLYGVLPSGHSPPRSPADLMGFERVTLAPPTGSTWVLTRGNQRQVIDSPPTAVVNDPATALSIVLGMRRGIALVPEFLVDSGVRSGRLTRVLQDWKTPLVDIHAVLPPGRNAVPAVRTLLDDMTARLKKGGAWINEDPA